MRPNTEKKISVILDTDIGGDIDDIWALVLLLKSPELDLRLVTTATGDTHYRAKVVVRLLEIAGRGDSPLGPASPSMTPTRLRPLGSRITTWPLILGPSTRAALRRLSISMGQ